MKKLLSYLFLITVLLSFNYVLAFSIERDLNFLKDLSNEDLNPLVATMKDWKNSQLNEKEKSNPQKYLNKVVENLEKYATTELNLKDIKNVSYKQILETVCKNKNIQFDKDISTKDLGSIFVRHMFIDTFNKMSGRHRESLIGALREAMSEEEFEELLEKIGGTSGLLTSSGETVNDLLLNGSSGDFVMATCLVSDAIGAVNEKQPKETTEQYLVYTGIIPAVTYIEALRIAKTQVPKNEDNSDFLSMLIVVSVPVFCVLLFLICMDPKKRAVVIKLINFLIICLFVSIVLILVMITMESAEDYIVIAFIVCVVLVSMLFSWLFSTQRKIIKRRIKKKLLKRSKNKKKLQKLKILKEKEAKEKNVSKIICPKCNTQNSKTNYSCTNCGYIFAGKDSEGKKENEIKNENKTKEEIKLTDNKGTEHTDKTDDNVTEVLKDENVKQKNEQQIKAENKKNKKAKRIKNKE